LTKKSIDLSRDLSDLNRTVFKSANHEWVAEEIVVNLPFKAEN